MNRLLLVLTLICATVLTPLVLRGQTPNDRAQWMTEIRQYKRTYLSKELGLSREQQAKFFPVYEEMEDRSSAIEDEARTMENRIAEAKDATDLEYEKATEALYDSKVQVAALEKEYADRFKEILTKKQLFQLKAAERQFSREIMRQHNRIRSIRRSDAK